ncbi:MAG: hypothetical protein ABFD61_08390 [Chloroherpetonaceae bacterium]
MNRIKKRNLFCIAAIVIFMVAANAKIKSNTIPYIYSENIVNVCDSLSKKFVLFFVVIDKIQKSDSLFGFDLQIRYDTTKLKITNYVKGNTLSEFFDIDFSYGLDGLINGYGIVSNVMAPPSYGDSILVGFSAEWLGNCPDSAFISLEELNFTSEFKRNYDSLNGGYVYAIRKQNNNIIETKFDTQDIKLKQTDSILETQLSIKFPKYHQTNAVDVKLNLKDDLSLIEANMHSGIGIIGNIDSIDNIISIANINQYNNEIIIDIKFKILNYNNLNNIFLKVDSVNTGDCNCIFGVRSDSVRINIDTLKDTLGIYEQTIDNYINITNDFVEILNPGGFQIAEIYNYTGNLIESVELINKPIIKIYLKDFKVGMYFLVLKTNSNNEIKKFYKYYSN